MLFGRPPFYGRTESEVEEKILRGTFTFPNREGTAVSKEAKQFIQKLLTYNPAQRYGAADALKDPWLHKILLQNKKLSKRNITLGQDILRNLAHFNVFYITSFGRFKPVIRLGKSSKTLYGSFW